MKPKNADRADDLKERSGEFSSRSSDPRSTSTDSAEIGQGREISDALKPERPTGPKRDGSDDRGS